MLEEMKFALNQIKRRKSTGPDGFPIDLMKMCNDKVLVEFLATFNNFRTKHCFENNSNLKLFCFTRKGDLKLM